MVVAPIAVVIGFIGVQVEDVVGSEKRSRDNQPRVPAWELRQARELEMLSAEASAQQRDTDERPAAAAAR